LGSRGGGGVILLYHRIAAGFDPLGLNVSPDHFLEHLDVVTQYAEAKPLAELLRSTREQPSGRRPALSVTFDDGYRDNLTAAMPLLERRGIPATVFVTACVVDGVRSMWWDDLSALVISPETARNHPTWTLSSTDDPTSEHELYRRLHLRIRSASSAQRDAILADLRASAPEQPPAYPLLTPDGVLALDAGDLIHIGGHTINHPHLSSLSTADQYEEIAGGRSKLGRLLGHLPNAFAYPFGTPADYNRRSVRAVARAGFPVACANFASRVGRRSPRLELPRFLVRDWSGSEFEERLALMIDARCE
jgi:peptidoglycan/xylan/chitin deacetylase (PgdA/CDA1 family)